MRCQFKVLTAFLAVTIVAGEVLVIGDGQINGTIMETRTGESFHAFLRIPFAEPPINELRFKAPIAKTPWSGVLNCTEFGDVCMQTVIGGAFKASEDCLFLNVFTKNIPVVGLKPVIVFVHGGAFEIGSANEQGARFLMERDVVLVVLNYRLGPFGFLAVGTSDIPGNAALKDQSLALKWVQKNIKYFGGDPDSVTLAGSSAGAHSVTAHLVSPMSKKLFHKLIAMSGALAWQKRLKTNNLEQVRNLASAVACPVESISDMVSCLKAKPAEELVVRNSYLHCPVLTWFPVVEGTGEEKFLVDDPNELFRTGNFSQEVKVMTGITENEFIQPAAEILESANETKTLNEKFEEVAPICFFFEGNDLVSAKEIGQKLKNFYLPFETIDIRSFNSLNNLFADSTIGNGVHRFVHYISNYTDVYYYKFSYIGRYSFFKYPQDKPYGVHHGDDLQYVFNSNMFGPLIELSDPENTMVQKMTRIIEQFARTGNPNNISDEYLKDLNWPQHSINTEVFMEIGVHFVAKNGLLLERFSVWDNLDKNSSCKVHQSITLILATFFLVVAEVLYF